MAITRNTLFLCIFIAAVAAGILVYVWYVRTPQTMLPTKTVTIGSTRVVAEIASTPQEQEQGLSGRSSLPEGKAMLFVFAEPQVLSFWMKDMHFPIDIIWIGADDSVLGSEQHISPDTYPAVFSSPASTQYALEVPAGFVEAHAIAEGAKLVVQ